MGRTLPTLRVSLRIQPQRMKKKQPDDKGEGTPRTTINKSPAGSHQRAANQHRPASSLQALAQIEILHQAKIAIAAEIPKNAGAHEDSLIAIVVAREPVAPPVDPTDRAQAPASFEKAVLERAAKDFRVLQQRLHPHQGIPWGQRVGMEEKQDIAACNISGRVHQGRTARMRRPNQSRATRYRSFG